MQLAVIAKEPLPGRVKTRLCPPFSPEEAADLALAALRDTLDVVRSTPAARRVLVLDGHPGPWVPSGFDVIAQHGRDLGARLANAFADCAATCPEAVVLVGMDTPQLTASQLLDAGRLVAAPAEAPERRAVIGPASDGGYWLLGLSQPDPRIHDGVPMSSSGTYARQVRRLLACGFDVRVTHELRDVDTARDAEAVAAAVPHSEFARLLARCARAAPITTP